MSQENVEVVQASIERGLATTSLDPSNSWTRRSSTSIPSAPWSREPAAASLRSAGRLQRSSKGGRPAHGAGTARGGGGSGGGGGAVPGRGRGSGVEVEGRESALWTLRDGKVVRYAWFHEPADALEAAGLSE